MARFNGIPVDDVPPPVGGRFGGNLVEESPGHEFSFSNMAGNLPQSSLDLASNTARMVTEPDKSSQGIANLFKGLTEKLEKKVHSVTPAEYWDSPLYKLAQKTSNVLADLGLPVNRLPDNKEDMTYDHIQHADSLINHFVGRYGSIDDALKTLENDPAGVVADTVGVGAGVGAGVNTLTKVAGKSIPSGLPGGMIEEVGKFSTKKTPEQHAKYADTILEEGLSFNRKGARKYQSILDDLNAEVDSIIKTAGKDGNRIPKSMIIDRLEKLKTDKSNKAGSTGDRATIDKIIKGEIAEFERSGKDYFTLSELQKYKKSAYRKVTDWSKDKPNKVKTQDEAYADIGIAAKEAIEEIAPETAAVNKRLGTLLDVKQPFQGASNRIANRDKFGMGDALKMGTGMGIDAQFGLGGAGTALGMTGAIAGKPSVKAAMAQALYKMQKSKGPINNSELVKAMIAGYPQMLSEQQNQYQDASPIYP